MLDLVPLAGSRRKVGHVNLQVGVIHAVRYCLALLTIDEVVDPHRLGVSSRTPFLPAILEVSHQLLLLGIDGDRRLVALELSRYRCVDMPELSITIGMSGTLF